ncbi:MAG: NarL family transcriptional regulator [Flavobacteriaceae bacterium]|nr:NarL family transcriptional regulator [Flavobacteriaceae bacterium]|tara:strand:- start:31823 stop:33031 length:1209 start_codon:yes stop_codon:yes gene_type:complete
MKNNILKVPYAKSTHGEEEIKAVTEVLKTSTQMGKNVSLFEKKVSEMFAKKFGLMTNSGTSSLMLAGEALDLPKGSEVITAAFTFATTVTPILKNNLIPVFIDSEKDTLNIDASRLEKFINKRTSALWIPNMLGNVPDWDIIREIADKYNLVVLEDSADTLGGTLRGKPTGLRSDVSICSFYGSHIINCAGNGGWVGFNDEKIATKARLLRSWGRTSSIFTDILESESLVNRFNIDLDGIPYDAKFVFEYPGYQMEPSEMGAAFGLVQLSNFEKVKKKRVMAFKRMEEIFSDFKDFIRLATPNPDAEVIWMHFPFTIREDAPFSRKDLQTFFELRGIQTRPPFSGNILRQPMIKNQKFLSPDTYINADDLMKNGVLIGCHQGLSEEQFAHVQEVSNDFFNQF